MLLGQQPGMRGLEPANVVVRGQPQGAGNADDQQRHAKTGAKAQQLWAFPERPQHSRRSDQRGAMRQILAPVE